MIKEYPSLPLPTPPDPQGASAGDALIKKLLAVAAVILVLGFLSFLMELPPLAFGWLHFLARNLGQVSVHPASVVTGAVFVALLIVAIHGCGSSFCRAVTAKSAVAPRWRFRWTLAILGVVVLMFVAGLSTIGLARHLGWMFSTADPTYMETVKFKMED